MSPERLIERDARMLVRAYGFQAAVEHVDTRLVGVARPSDVDLASYWLDVRSAIVDLYAGLH